MCATCHTLFTSALDKSGNVVGELPEQVPYLEWLHSDYRETQSCQSCHMPVVEEPTPIASVLGEPREGLSRHSFVGGNFFMLRLLETFRDALGVVAAPGELEAAAVRREEHPRTQAASLEIISLESRDGRLHVDLAVNNQAGHKLPTAYPSRRAWLHLVVRDANGEVAFESGAVDPSGRIAGNDNDDDPARYEPHHDVIETPDQVQVYEAILGAPNGDVTTGLLTAVRYLKDNRLLPHGFDKLKAGADIAVHGAALRDESFAAGSDRLRYTIALGTAQGPYDVSAELLYQPIGYRWAHNLRDYPAEETDRFVGYFEALAPRSSATLAKAQASTR
jgi:hypothetical protein